MCGKEYNVRFPETLNPESAELPAFSVQKKGSALPEDEIKAVFSFKKEGKAIYLGHLDTVHVIERAIQCADLPVKFSSGYNPKPKLEFAHPLSVGISGEEEIMGVELLYTPEESEDEILKKVNEYLPEGFSLTAMASYPLQQDKNRKKKNLMSIYAGSDYILTPHNDSTLPPGEELIQTLKEKAAEMDVASDYDFTALGPQIKVHALFRNKKMNNIVKFLKEVLQEDPYQLMDVTRTGILAAPKGTGTASYLDLDSSQN